MLNTVQAAEYLNVSRSLLEKMRHFKRPGPVYTRVGHAVRYRIEDLEAYIEQQRVAA